MPVKSTIGRFFTGQKHHPSELGDLLEHLLEPITFDLSNLDFDEWDILADLEYGRDDEVTGTAPAG